METRSGERKSEREKEPEEKEAQCSKMNNGKTEQLAYEHIVKYAYGFVVVQSRKFYQRVHFCPPFFLLLILFYVFFFFFLLINWLIM